MTSSGTGERIAAAALAIVTEEGAQAVTMRRVAADAGVSAMATYRHFPNRAALLGAVADRVFAQLGDAWGKRGTEGTCTDRLDELLDAFLDFALGQPKLYSFLLIDRRDGARQFPTEFRAGASPAFAPVTAAVEHGIRNGELQPDDSLEVTLAITAPAMGLVQLYLGGRIGLDEAGFRELCKRSVGRVLDGLRGTTAGG